MLPFSFSVSPTAHFCLPVQGDVTDWSLQSWGQCSFCGDQERKEMCWFLGEKYLEGPTSTGVHHPIMRPLSVPSESFCSSSFSFTSKNLSQGTPPHCETLSLTFSPVSFKPMPRYISASCYYGSQSTSASRCPNSTLFVSIISPRNMVFPIFNHMPT